MSLCVPVPVRRSSRSVIPPPWRAAPIRADPEHSVKCSFVSGIWWSALSGRLRQGS